MPLPRELQLIVDDISNQREHLLEWEVFGNATEDMRVVLTWRHLKVFNILYSKSKLKLLHSVVMLFQTLFLKKI